MTLSLRITTAGDVCAHVDIVQVGSRVQICLWVNRLSRPPRPAPPTPCAPAAVPAHLSSSGAARRPSDVWLQRYSHTNLYIRNEIQTGFAHISNITPFVFALVLGLNSHDMFVMILLVTKLIRNFLFLN